MNQARSLARLSSSYEIDPSAEIEPGLDVVAVTVVEVEVDGRTEVIQILEGV